jgi:hypothetical protein
MKKYLFTLLLFMSTFLLAKAQTRIIDMHVHSYTESDIRELTNPTDYYGTPGSSSAEELRLATYKEFEKWNIIKAVVSGNPESVEEWATKDSSQRVIRGILIFHPDDYKLDSVKFEQMVKNKEIEVFGGNWGLLQWDYAQ